MVNPPFEVLYEDNHLLAVNKPPAMATMGATGGRPTMLAQAKSYIKRKYHKPGNVYLGVVSRLDAMTSGVLLIARTSKAARRLSEQFRQGRVEKTYWAVVAGCPEPADAVLQHWLRKDDAAHKVRVVSAEARGAKLAELRYRTLASLPIGTWLEIHPKTGRKHQIRVQLAHVGHPILGDRKYGSQIDFAKGIALHARQLVVEHPVRRSPVQLVAALPQTWRSLGVEAT